MLFDEALSYLLSLGHETLTIKLGLRNTETLLSALGNPQESFSAVQIAGTNGKGSVAVMLESICRAAGIRVGLFTSPHLVSITERIRIDGERIAEPDFARFTLQVKETTTDLTKQRRLKTLPTFFEHVTAIALLAFREAKVELAILETGLGGRLDSTTAAGAEIVAITPIAMDHEEHLGHSLGEIAAEKAAIIRSGVTAIVGPQSKEALEVIVSQCEAVGVVPRVVDSAQAELRYSTPSDSDGNISPNLSARAGRYRSRYCNASDDGRFCVSFEMNDEKYEHVRLGLRGRHQMANAAVAIALAQALGESDFPIGREAIIHGVETAEHPGRLEFWEGQPRILFDGAHNPGAAKALRDYLDEFVKEPITMIFGAMRDKALNEMATILFPAVDKLVLTQFDNLRAASLETLKLAVTGSFDQPGTLYAFSPNEALRMAKEITPPNGIICVTGSLYLIGAIQQALRDQARHVASQGA